MIDEAVSKLITYAARTGLIEESEKIWAVNAVLETLKIDSYADPGVSWGDIDLAAVLDELTHDAFERGVIPGDSTDYRDLLDTSLMGRLTPRPAQVIEKFKSLYAQSPKAATDWYYRFSQDTNYIRRDRIARDMKWTVGTGYGTLDITVNLSKPEKDPKAIAAARNLPAATYPRCQLCAENEGYAGRLNHPARQNHRTVPITINGSPWFLQYSPYVYYNEHCICFNREHTPMKIDRACFEKLLDFVGQFPHYFVGSNADLPIVGGSILAHDHFQGGHYTFPMERAPIGTPLVFRGFEDVTAGIVRWPLSVIRIRSPKPQRLVDLADRILTAWRGYTDESAFIFAETDGTPHNTITPIARRRGEDYELDLALRNNITTEEYPLGVYHPHPEIHHIKQENIGLIEVMGLAVLPSRLKAELTAVAEGLVSGADLTSSPLTAKHAQWAEELKSRYAFTDSESALEVVKHEAGLVFAKGLEHCGVFGRDEKGKNEFLRFVASV